ncbi:protein of unknown function [Candidatus Methylopumilus turicensis]|uniref:Uncharacterized protein n=1 Tax=Candidatus Methylopumilus turicensis TaxID=1581680 RepID=A0A0B7IXG4_9PROT|nr:protein of unknown function [Candidatus Methylopumilus turicensis]
MYYSTILAIANVHCYFKTETHFSSSWFSPHGVSPNYSLKKRYRIYIICLHAT